MLQNTPSKAEIRQQIKFNDRLFLKNRNNAGIKDFFKKIGRGAKKVWDKIKTPVKKAWDFISDGPGNALLNLIPKVGPAIANTIKTVDDVIDTGTEIAKDIKSNSKQIKQNITDPNSKLLDNVDVNKLKQDFDWVKDKTMEVYNKVKDKLSPQQKASAINAAGMINLELLRNLKPLQRGKLKKILPYAPYIDINKHSRVTIPKFIRDLDKDAPKTIDNTGGRLFLKGYASGINLNDSDSGRISLSGTLALTEPQSGACNIKTEQKKSGALSKEEIYKKLFG
jgi:hypothetical protein